MTPEAKSAELINKFTFARQDDHEKLVAKQCALIAVDEILELDVWDNPHNAENGKLYWNQVKEHLNKA